MVEHSAYNGKVSGSNPLLLIKIKNFLKNGLLGENGIRDRFKICSVCQISVQVR